MLATIRPGDTVVVYKLDRIARSLKDLRIIIERIEVAGAQFRSLTPSRQAQQEDDM
jgi:DNA invertase Pin-like site-specific DNA recombinase